MPYSKQMPQAFTRNYTHDTRLMYRELCGACSPSSIEGEDEIGRYCKDDLNNLYICGLLKDHEGNHQGWISNQDGPGWRAEWRPEANCFEQLHEPSRWEIVMETEFYNDDCEWRMMVQMLRGHEYSPDDSMPEDLII